MLLEPLDAEEFVRRTSLLSQGDKRARRGPPNRRASDRSSLAGFTRVASKADDRGG